MQRCLLLAISAMFFVLVGCWHRPDTGESIAEVCQLTNNGKLKAVSGYLTTHETTTSCSTTCALRLRAQKALDGKEMDVTFVIGSDNNQLQEVPTGFTESDIHILDREGKAIKGGDTVRVTGRMTVTRRDDNFACTVEVGKIERL